MKVQNKCVDGIGTPCCWIFNLIGNSYCKFCKSCKRSPYKQFWMFWMKEDKYKEDPKRIGTIRVDDVMNDRVS